jgi:hypothetical protein
MFSFKEYLLEAKAKKEKKTSGFKPGDSAGKLFELLKAKEQNGGEFPESYRAEGKRPKEIHDITAKKMFGDKFEEHPEYKNLANSVKIAERHNTDYNRLVHGHDPKKGYQRVAWTSQPADHESETGTDDPNSVADSIPTLHHGQKISQSDKLTAVGSSVNYKNPGIETLGKISGADFSGLGETHKKLLKQHGISTSDKGYETWANWKGKRDYIPSGEERQKAEEIEQSSKLVNQDAAKKMHAGFINQVEADRKDGGNKVRDSLMNAIAPPTHLKTVVTHTELNEDGTHKKTKVYDLHDHINQYLNHFRDFHVDPEHRSGLSSVTVHGHYRHPTDPNHPMNGKKMPVASIAVYSGGRPNSIKPRGAITLPSENNKEIKYQNQVSSDPEHHTISETKSSGKTQSFSNFNRPSVARPTQQTQKQSKPKAPIPVVKDKFSGTNSPIASWKGSANPPPANEMFGKQVHADHEINQ